jgi:hypothetical protein
LTPTRSTRLTFFLLAAALAALLIEAGAAGTTAFLVSRGWMASIPVIREEQVADYMKSRDPVLGWRADVTPVNGACVSTYGDSFTTGSAEASYPKELARLIGCAVANYGVGGYGSDQAMLLAREMRTVDNAPISIIGHVSENILRNLNQYRNLLYPGQEVFFKPRFIFDGEQLRSMPVPIGERSDFQLLMASPESILDYDEFVSRPRRAFPYTLSIARWLFTDFHARAFMARVPRHEPFYHPDHPAGGVQTTAAVLTSFAVDKRRDIRRPIILLIPVGHDFKYVARGHPWPDQPLASALAASQEPVIHAGPKMMEKLKGADPCSLYEPCNGHFNERGYRMLAEIVADAIRDLSRRSSPAPGNR